MTILNILHLGFDKLNQRKKMNSAQGANLINNKCFM